jgi:3-deoxy-manno-octulosonate cytidylyltransferase (CMP-KDO synthetase)
VRGIESVQDQVAAPRDLAELRRVLIAVPARIGSTRLPQKLLRRIGPLSVIGHVAARLQELVNRVRSDDRMPQVLIDLVVATDHDGIASAVREQGVPVFLSRADHSDGTSRIREAWLDSLASGDGSDELVVNIQGDEPFFSVLDVAELIAAFSSSRHRCSVGTLAHRCSDLHQFLSPAVVKVVLSDLGEALYFSRAPIPWPRDHWGAGGSGLFSQSGLPADCQKMPPRWFFWRHAGIYVYRGDFLAGYTGTSSGSEALEHQEGLEQLGFLRSGERIRVVEAREATLGIDTEADLERAEHLWQERASQ